MIIPTYSISQGFSNEPRTPGEILAHTGQEMGRLAIMDIIGDYLITVPEAPSSPPGSDFLVRAWDISDPENPIEVARFKETVHPFQAHGLVKRGNQIYIGGFPNNALQVNQETGEIEEARWTGPSKLFIRKSGMAYPYAGTDYWSYGTPSGNAKIFINRQQVADWDHLNTTGVVGFANFMGDQLIYGADQSKSGVASYDISDPRNPILLDVLNRPDPHPTITDRDNPVEGGIGGYWNEIYGNYLVFPRRGSNPGLQVVDFSDPTNLKVQCEFFARDPKHNINPLNNDFAAVLYVGFQDEWMFGDRYKVNIETCELALVFDEIGAGAEMGQYSRPIGNLLLAGGGNNWRIAGNAAGLSIWSHTSEPDTRPPFVSHHIPQADRTGYPIVAPISIHIPETLRSETIIPGETLRLIKSDGTEIPIDYVLSHTGMLTVYAATAPENPLDGWLEPNTTYQVTLAGIQDAMKNVMAEYSFQFTTGQQLGPLPTPSISPAPIPTPTQTISPSPLPTPTPLNSEWAYIIHKPTNFKIQSCATEPLSPITSRPNANRGNCVQWKPIPNEDYFYIQNRASELLMKPDTATNGSPISVVPNHWRGNWTQWYFEDRGDNYGHIINKATGKYIFLPATNSANITQQPSSWRGDYTRWLFEPVERGPNVRPVINSILLSDETISPGEVFTINVIASDENNDDLEYRFNFGEIYTDWSAAPSADHIYTEPGTFLIIVQVRDPDGLIRTGTRALALE